MALLLALLLRNALIRRYPPNLLPDSNWFVAGSGATAAWRAASSESVRSGGSRAGSHDLFLIRVSASRPD